MKKFGIVQGLLIVALSSMGCSQFAPRSTWEDASASSLTFVSSRLDLYSNGLDVITMSPHHKYATDFTSSVYMLDTQHETWKPLLYSSPSVPLPVSISPNGEVLAMSRYEDDGNSGSGGAISITLIDQDGADSVLCYKCSSPSWSKSGEQILFYQYSDDTIKVIDVNTGNAAPIVSINADKSSGNGRNGFFFARSSWSLDNTSIVYEDVDESGEWYIWQVKISGENPEKITRGRYPAWSPTRDDIAYIDEDALHVVSLSTGESVTIDTGIDGASWPEWSPDSQMLAFVGNESGNEEIYIANRDGTELRNITNHPAQDRYPIWHKPSK